MFGLFGPGKETKLNRTEEYIIDSIFLNLKDHTKLNHKLESRFKQDIKNYPVNGEQIFFTLIVDKKHRVSFINSKYYVKDKNEWRNFQNEFGSNVGWHERDIFPATYIYMAATQKKDGDRAPYSVGGFITETSGLQHDQLKNLILKKLKEKDIINKVFKRCK